MKQPEEAKESEKEAGQGSVAPSSEGEALSGLLPQQPRRLQRKRTKGWTAPIGAVCVTRPGKWGNPYPVGLFGLEGSLLQFRVHLEKSPEGRALCEEAKRELRGKDLLCWCAPGSPCHADIWLEIANS